MSASETETDPNADHLRLERLCDAGFDHFGAQGHRVPGLENAFAQFVIIGQVVDQDTQAADALQGFAADTESGPKAVTQAALDPAGQQDAGLEVGGDTEGYVPLLPGFTPIQANYGGGFDDDFLMVLSPGKGAVGPARTLPSGIIPRRTLPIERRPQPVEVIRQ